MRILVNNIYCITIEAYLLLNDVRIGEVLQNSVTHIPYILYFLQYRGMITHHNLSTPISSHKKEKCFKKYTKNVVLRGLSRYYATFYEFLCKF